VRTYLKFLGMTDETNPASELARKRWDKASEEEKRQVGKDLAAARWPAGYVAKRPASSRNTGRPVGRPKKKADTALGDRLKLGRRPGKNGKKDAK